MDVVVPEGYLEFYRLQHVIRKRYTVLKNRKLRWYYGSNFTTNLVPEDAESGGGNVADRIALSTIQK